MMWRTAGELAGLPGMPSTPEHVRRVAVKAGWESRSRQGAIVGRKPLEYRVTELPEATQQALALSAANAARPAAQAIATGRQVGRAVEVQARAEAIARLGIELETTGALDPALNPKLDLFQRFAQYHERRGGPVWPAVVEFCALWDRGQVCAHERTRDAYPALSAKTFESWYRRWRLHGVSALLKRRPRSDRGLTRLTREDELHDAFVGVMAAMHSPTARHVIRAMALHVPADRLPAIRTVQLWMKEYKATNKVALLKLKNPDGWRNKYMPAFGRRDEHIQAPNVEWQLDSTIADAQQRVEIAFNMHEGDTGEIRRHALVAVIDVFTRRAQVLVSRTSSANAVKAVTRRAILAWGLPERVKTDNGKDYTAQDYEFSLQALKVGHTLCTPFSPDQKPFIERFLGTLLHDLFPMLQGFVGHDVAARKAIESGRSFAQRFGHGGCDLHMTPEQLQGVIDGWLDEYHGRSHSELGCSPNDMADRHTTHVVRVDERALDLFMMPVAGKGTRTVGKRGISLGTAWFSAPELARVDVMGREVYCRQDEADLGALHVFALDGTYICRALDHTRLGINRAELAARTRALESATVKPMVDALRKARRRGLVDQAVQSIYADRTASAAAASDNVTRLPTRVVNHSTPAVASVIASAAPQHDQARAAARAALAQAEAAEIVAMDTPKQRYSAWVRLTARAGAGEQLAARDVDWMRSYQGSNEWAAWDALHEGNDPIREQTNHESQ